MVDTIVGGQPTIPQIFSCGDLHIFPTVVEYNTVTTACQAMFLLDPCTAGHILCNASHWPGTTSQWKVIFGSRYRGSPSTAIYYLQCQTLFTDFCTHLVAGDSYRVRCHLYTWTASWNSLLKMLVLYISKYKLSNAILSLSFYIICLSDNA